MPRKRKQVWTPGTASEASGPPKKQHQPSLPLQRQQEAAFAHSQVAFKQEAVEEGEEEEEEEVEEEEVEEEEVEEEVEEEEEEEDDEEEEEEEEEEAKEGLSGQSNQTSHTSSNDGDDEPMPKLLEPFSKEQLVSLLLEAADKHRDVADRIRKMADEDPVHRKIFVHGLGWDATAETLTNAFKQYGEIEDCKAVCDKVSGKSKGYGFILFKTRRGARNSLKEPQKKIGNRMTACQLASTGPVPAHGATQSAPAPVQHSVSEYTQRKIYVSNVGADLDPKKLTDFFAKYGDIEEGPLGLDKVTGKPKGFCLFVYRTVESAKKALEEPHKSFEGHILHCQKAIDGPKPGKLQHTQQQNAHNPQLQRNGGTTFAGGAGAGLAPLMAGQAGAGIGFAQGVTAAPALNPALGQALTALLATQGAGLGLTNLLGTLGSAAAVNPAVPAPGHALQSAYGNQLNISPSVIGGYGNQAGYPNQHAGQGASGRGQHGGQFGGVGSYMGH